MPCNILLLAKGSNFIADGRHYGAMHPVVGQPTRYPQHRLRNDNAAAVSETLPEGEVYALLLSKAADVF